MPDDDDSVKPEHVPASELLPALVPDTAIGVFAPCQGWEQQPECGRAAQWFVDAHGCRHLLLCAGCWAGLRSWIFEATRKAVLASAIPVCSSCGGTMMSLLDWYPMVRKL